MAGGSGFYWEHDRLKSNLLHRSGPALLTGPNSPDGALRGQPDGHYISISSSQIQPPHPLHRHTCLSLGHSLVVSTWKVIWQQHPGSPCWSKSEIQTLFSSVFEKADTEVRGQVKANRNRTIFISLMMLIMQYTQRCFNERAYQGSSPGAR